MTIEELRGAIDGASVDLELREDAFFPYVLYRGDYVATVVPGDDGRVTVARESTAFTALMVALESSGAIVEVE